MKLTKQLLIVAAFAGVMVSTAGAATINWTFSEIVNTPSPLKNNTGTGFLQSDGNLFLAENSGGVVTSLDGITFAAGTLSLGAENTTYHVNDTLNPLTSSGTYGSGGVVSLITLGSGGVGVDLVAGDTYRIQAIIMDGRGNQSGRTFEVDGLATDHALGTSGSTWGNALLATGTFVADGTSQLFTLEAKEANGNSANGQLNAIAVHSFPVPEPSSTALLGLGGLALIMRRRK